MNKDPKDVSNKEKETQIKKSDLNKQENNNVNKQENNNVNKQQNIQNGIPPECSVLDRTDVKCRRLCFILYRSI